MTFQIENLPIGRHEFDTCVFSSLQSILRGAGGDDLTSLGTAWDFMFPMAGVRREEYFVSVPEGSSLVERLMPFSGWHSAWTSTDSAQEAWDTLKTELAKGDPVVLAVDNFHLPFRPAYGDVHSKHLILVYGYDEVDRTVEVLDATPPRFKGNISIDDLQRARGSENRREGLRDHFFASNVIGFDMLSIQRPERLTPQHPLALYARMIDRADFEMLGRSSSETWLCGIQGIKTLAGWVLDTPLALTNDIFILTGTVLAQRARLTDYLESIGRAAPSVSERMVEIVDLAHDITHDWATIRILCSREAQERPNGLGERLARRLNRVAAQEDFLLSLCKQSLSQFVLE